MIILAWMPIPLTQGLYALVDGEDYEQLSKYKWYAHRDRNTYYAQRRSGKDTIRMHRKILGLQKGDKTLSDHKNCNGLDNRRQNLRHCTLKQNLQNRILHKHSSKYKGVSLVKKTNKWLVRIGTNGKIYIGYFDNEVDAGRAYDKAAIKLYGEFACLNFPMTQLQEN